MNRIPLTAAVVATLLFAAVSAAAAAPAAASAGAHGASGPMAQRQAVRKKTPPKPSKQIDINGASRKKLMTLPGIGGPEAERIIANRPYLSKAELVTKQVLGAGPFQSLRHQVVALQKQPPKTPAKAKA